MDDKNLISELTDEQLDALLAYTPEFNDKNKENIKALAFEKIKSDKKHVPLKRTFLYSFIAATILILSSLVVAASMNVDLGEIFNSFFNNPNVTDKIEIGKIAEYDGIEAKVISAYTDGNHAYAVMELKDLRENRLSEDIDVLFENKDPNYFASHHTPVVFDENERKATFGVRIWFNKSIKEETNISLSIDKILKDFEYDKVELPDFPLHSYVEEKDMISQMDWFSTVSDDPKEHNIHIYNEGSDRPLINRHEIDFLNLDELNEIIPGVDWAVVTNVGFKDELLHLQVKRTDGSEYSHKYDNFILIDKSGNEITAFMQLAKGYYQEFVFHIGDIENLKDMKLAYSYSKKDSEIYGPWNLDITIESNAENKSIGVESQNSPYFKQFKITCSPMTTSIQFTIKNNLIVPYTTENINNYIRSFDDPYITLKDGSIVKLVYTINREYNSGVTFEFKSEYLNVSDIHSITFCGEEYLFNDKN